MNFSSTRAKFLSIIMCSCITHIMMVSTVSAVDEPILAPKPYSANDQDAYHSPKPDDYTNGTTTTESNAIAVTTEQLMQQQALHGTRAEHITRYSKPVCVDKNRRNRPQNAKSLELNYPTPIEENLSQTEENVFKSPQIIGRSFTGPQFSDVPLFPPDSMGVVGPTQFTVCINGRIKTYNKTTGLADGVMNVDTDVFFNLVRNGAFTSDPRIRYDRLTGRWFIIMINVPNNFTQNRCMLAVSNSSTITPSTIWHFFFFNAGTGTFLDYPTLGIDANALYIGGQTFSNTDTGKVYVVRKSSVLGVGPLIVTTFSNIINPVTGVGPYVPQGVDNFDATATIGYFIGVDNATFGTLVLRAIINPGGAPAISGNIVLTVPATQFPLLVPHLGNTHGTNGYLDSIDDRLMCAHIRNRHLWTVHNIGINNTGAAQSTITRNGARWYEIVLNGLSPVLTQAGTLFTTSFNNDPNQRHYWMPSIMTTGQNHMAIGCSTAGTNEYANAATAGKLATDPSNTIQAATLLTASATAYNPAGDPGSSSGRRWGDYSYTSVDPNDDMTMWTIQEFCNATNSWAVRIAKLLAPIPATPTSASPSNIHRGLSSVTITITGRSMSGSGFFDPGTGFNNRLTASVSGGVVVNSVTFIDPTHISLNLSTIGTPLGFKNVTITNPDGQNRTVNSLINVIA